MALVIANKVFETTTSIGTGSLILAGAQTGYRSFSGGIGINNTTYYSVTNANLTEWESGLGTVSSDGLSLARTTVYDSSNGGALVNFSAGLKSVFVDIPAMKLYYKDESNNAPTLVGAVLTTPTISGGTIQNTNINSIVNLLLMG